jgi:GDP-4-dehydro-6-deoxy-D-mannose reductase
MKNAFITGLTGFVGTHLANHLLENNFSVSGTYLTQESFDRFERKDEIKLYKLDLLSEEDTFSILRSVNPDYIFHLAAASSPRESFKNPKRTFENNISSQLNLFESIKKLEFFNTNILIVSSAEVYGHVDPKFIPINEDAPLNPTNPYAVSKIAQDFLGMQYFYADKLKVVRVRPFNHVGPGQSSDFVISAFAKRISDIENGKEKTMRIGNLASRRDFTDVRDMVKAYLLTLEMGQLGEVYNLGSGKSYEIKEILDMLKNMAKVEIKTEEDPSLMLPSDDPELRCDFSKFNHLTGWKPEIPIEKTLEDTLDYWRKQD